MSESSRVFIRSLWPAWLYWQLLPLPAVLFWRTGEGRFIALCCFFASCTGLVVYAFHRVFIHAAGEKPLVESARPAEAWRVRMLVLGVALLLQWSAFSSFCLIFNDAHDSMAPVLAFLSLIPSLCIAPYITLATRKPFVSLVLTVFLVGCMKLVAGSVTVLVYGWDASAHGHTTLTWTQPNLIVCTLVIATSILSGAFYFLGMWRFYSIYDRVN